MKYNHELNTNLRAACKTTSSTDDNDHLYPLVASGDAYARQRIIINNMPLVISLVESYLSSRTDYVYLQDDLIAEGFLGLVEAANNLATPGRIVTNPTSYLSRSIRFHIYRAAKHSPYQTCEKDISKMMLGARSNTISSIDTRDIIDSCCESDDDFTILKMREQGHSFQEISHAINVSVGTAHNRYVAIRERFDAKMKELQQ